MRHSQAIVYLCSQVVSGGDLVHIGGTPSESSISNSFLF